MQILLDKETRRPRLEGFDAPLERFLELSKAAGFEVRQLHHSKTEGHSEFLLYGVGWRDEGMQEGSLYLSQLPRAGQML